ncbi:MAG: hypothetical protein QOJ79_3637 [Actinomycetota bacterium]|jgi:hypothetical protein|nr:hypothetical protein [Actinomycetota bacterium]
MSQPSYAPVQPAAGPGPVGQVRGTGLCIVLFLITLGIYGFFWIYGVHNEMKRHTGRGIGGGIAVLIWLLLSFVSPFLVSGEVGQLYSSTRRQPPVTGLTGLWATLGALIIVGPIIWFVQTNNALNDYWRGLGAR